MAISPYYDSFAMYDDAFPGWDGSNFLALYDDFPPPAPELAEQPTALATSSEPESTDENELKRLPPSKSPLIDAIIYCALKKLGMSLDQESNGSIELHIEKFADVCVYIDQVYYKNKSSITQARRVKSFKDWFENFPRKNIYQSRPFTIQVKSGMLSSVRPVIERMSALIQGRPE